jgi:hypothetical protein
MGKLYVTGNSGKASKNIEAPYILYNGEVREVEKIYYGYDNKANLVYPIKTMLSHFTIGSNAEDLEVVLEG